MRGGSVILHLGGDWLGFDGRSLTTLPPYPRLGKPASVLEDFTGSIFGVMSMDGSSAHAGALVERKVRDEGLVDGESHVLIHRRNAIAGAVQALYTAVPVELWQRTQSWANSQPDHCLVMPLAALLAHHLSPGNGIIFHYGRQFALLAQQGNMLVHASVQAYSEEMDDLKSAMTMLGEQTLARRTDGAPLKLSFCALKLSSSAEDENALIKSFTRVAQIELRPAPAENIVDQNGINCRSSLPYLLKPWSTRDAVNPPVSKWLAWAEEMLPASMIASTIVAIGLFAYGGYLNREAADQNDSTQRVVQAVADKAHSTGKLQTNIGLPASFKTAQGFYNRLTMIEGEHNPYKALVDVRNAAGKDLRIMRVRLDNSDKQSLSLVMEGAARQAAFDTRVLADFVSRLRAQGYAVTPLDPSDSSRIAPHFSYRLEKNKGLQQ